MSIAAFYRNWIPFTKSFFVFNPDIADFEVVYETVYVKGNIQPFKVGLVIELTETGTLWNDTLVLYTKTDPTTPLDSNPDAAPSFSYFYDDGRWYVVNGKQNWSKAGRNVKHFKFIGQHSEGVGSGLGTPTPLPELVEEFEIAIAHFGAVTDLYTEET